MTIHLHWINPYNVLESQVTIDLFPLLSVPQSTKDVFLCERQWVTIPVPYAQQELLTLQEHLSSPLVLSSVGFSLFSLLCCSMDFYALVLYLCLILALVTVSTFFSVFFYFFLHCDNWSSKCFIYGLSVLRLTPLVTANISYIMRLSYW